MHQENRASFRGRQAAARRPCAVSNHERAFWESARSRSLPRASPAARSARTRRLFRPTDCAEARPGRRRTRTTPRWRRDGVAGEARGDRGSGEEERTERVGSWKGRKKEPKRPIGLGGTLPQQSQITRPHPCPTHGRKRAKIRSANLEH